MPASTPTLVLPATAADCPALGALDASAFLPTKLGRATAGRADPASVAAAFARRFERLLLDPHNVLLKAVRAVPDADGGESEAIVGLAWYERPAPEGSDCEKGAGQVQGEAVDRGWGPGTEEELMAGLWVDLEEHAKAITERHYHRAQEPRARGSDDHNADIPLTLTVQSLGTDPRHQRTGAGSALVHWGIARAERERVAIHLDATEGERVFPCTGARTRGPG